MACPAAVTMTSRFRMTEAAHNLFNRVRLVPGSWPAAAQAICEGLAKLLAPLTNRLMGDDNATFSQKQLNIPPADAEHVVQPHSVTDALGGEAVAVVWAGWRLHAASLAGLPCFVMGSVEMRGPFPRATFMGR
jgi:hypothetical protein